MSERILVVGAYGFIGTEVVRHLRSSGHKVFGLGRNAREAKRVFPDIEWIMADLTDYTTTGHWLEHLGEIDFVVNCSGILQDQNGETTLTIHALVVEALALACTQASVGLIQISSVGAELDASTEFLRTKAMGEQKIAQSGIKRYWIFRPGLVLGQSAYGGTALLRMVASFPFVLPMAFPDARIQTVSLSELANCVEGAISGRLTANQRYDLVENEVHSLAEILRALRDWLGWGRAQFEPIIPMVLTRTLNRSSDFIGNLGWKSQLRSTSSKVLEEGVTGDPTLITKETGNAMQSLEETLQSFPARAEDRIAARSNLLKPVVLITLIIFWFCSGVIGLVQHDQAITTLTKIGWTKGFATMSVIIWSCVDIALAVFLAIRKYAKAAALGMIVVSFIYIASAALFTPALWVDPLGPIIKIFPALVLTIVACAMLEVR